VRLVYVTPTHQHPLGVSMAMHRRRALLAWAADRNVAIVEDDYDSEFRFDGRPLESLHSLDADGRVLYVGTFSKTLMPSLRLGFVVSPPSLRRPLAAAKYLCDWHTNVASQATLAAFIDEGGFALHVRRMQVRYQARYDRILEVLDRRADGLLSAIPSQAGMHVTAIMPDGTPPDTLPLARKAWEARVAIFPLSQMYMGPPTSAGFMIGFGAIARSRIPAGLTRLCDALS
jgi:GntR family transcriptional regulator/MocR family aminotransferase